MGSAQGVFEMPCTGDIAFSPPTPPVNTSCGLASCGHAACPILCVIAHASGARRPRRSAGSAAQGGHQAA